MRLKLVSPGALYAVPWRLFPTCKLRGKKKHEIPRRHLSRMEPNASFTMSRKRYPMAAGRAFARVSSRLPGCRWLVPTTRLTLAGPPRRRLQNQAFRRHHLKLRGSALLALQESAGPSREGEAQRPPRLPGGRPLGSLPRSSVLETKRLASVAGL